MEEKNTLINLHLTFQYWFLFSLIVLILKTDSKTRLLHSFGKLRRIGIPNQIGQSDFKSEDKSERRIQSVSKSDVQIGFQLSDHVYYMSFSIKFQLKLTFLFKMSKFGQFLLKSDVWSDLNGLPQRDHI